MKQIIKEKIEDFFLNLFFTIVFIIPVAIIGITKNEDLLKEFYAPKSSVLLHTLYIAVTAIILYMQIVNQNKKEQANIKENIEQGVDDYWFFRFKVDIFFQYANITLACVIINTMISGYFLNEPLQNDSCLGLLAILANYFIIGFFSFTSPRNKHFKIWRIALLLIFLIFESCSFVQGLAAISRLITS